MCGPSISQGPHGLVATPFGVQDSSMLKILADSNGLIIRPPFAPAAPAGDARSGADAALNEPSHSTHGFQTVNIFIKI